MIKPCTVTPELWFAKDTASVAAAKQQCSTCPFRDECLETTLEYERLSEESRGGIFGGLTPEERNRHRARRA